VGFSSCFKIVFLSFQGGELIMMHILLCFKFSRNYLLIVSVEESASLKIWVRAKGTMSFTTADKWCKVPGSDCAAASTA
jgi:hypothetical protein